MSCAISDPGRATLSTEAPPFNQTFTVHSYEVDTSERLALRALCGYLQEAAGHDAARLGVSMAELARYDLAWVLHWLDLRVDSYPRLGEALRVSTWPKRFDRLRAERDFEVHDERSQRLAYATSRWVVVDLSARRLVRLPEFIRRLPVPDRAPALVSSPDGVASIEQVETEKRFLVRRSDLDVVRHVNNTRYVGWAVETVPDHFYEEHWPVSLGISFRQESVYGETVISHSERVEAAGSAGFRHQLVSDGGRELARAVSRWERRQNP